MRTHVNIFWCVPRRSGAVALREVSKQQEEVQDFKKVAVQHDEKVFSNKMQKNEHQIALEPKARQCRSASGGGRAWRRQ